MSARVQVILSEEERERFAREAAREGLSLSAWMRRAARDRLTARPSSAPTTPEELEAFFAACDAREQGREPDWEEQLDVLRRSKASGSSGT